MSGEKKNLEDFLKGSQDLISKGFNSIRSRRKASRSTSGSNFRYIAVAGMIALYLGMYNCETRNEYSQPVKDSTQVKRSLPSPWYEP